MTQMVAFWYSENKSQRDYLSFFDDLADTFAITLAEDMLESRQLFTEEGIEEIARKLDISLQNTRGQHGHGLDDDCVACLTRMVTYCKRVYRSMSPDTEIVVEYCDENNYPVIGVDLWTEGCSALPAGMFIVNSADSSIARQLISAVQAYKNEFKDDS